MLKVRQVPTILSCNYCSTKLNDSFVCISAKNDKTQLAAGGQRIDTEMHNFFPVHGVAQQSQGGILRGLAQIHARASVGALAMDQVAMSLSL